MTETGVLMPYIGLIFFNLHFQAFIEFKIVYVILWIYFSLYIYFPADAMSQAYVYSNAISMTNV